MTEPRSAVGAASIIVFSSAFSGPDSLSGWSNNGIGSAVIETECLKVHTEKQGDHLTSLALSVEKLRGKKVAVSARVKAEDIRRAPEPWNGAKLMLQIDSPAGTDYRSVSELAGTFGWKEAGFSAGIPTDATGVRLFLGIGQASGTVWFDDVEVRITGEEIPHAAAQADPLPPEKLDRRTAVPRLRGVLYGPRGHEADIRKLAEWKANLIRWHFYNHDAHSPDKRFDLTAYNRWLDETMAEVDSVLPLCRKLGIQIVIDLHTPPGGEDSDGMAIFNRTDCQKTFIDAWDRLASHYAGEPAIWGYDLLNEPVEGGVKPGRPGWRSLSEIVARRVRKIDPGHAIIVEPGPHGGWGNLPYFKPLDVPGVVYSVHMYEPLCFTHQGVFDGMPTGVAYPGEIDGTRWDMGSLRRALEPVRQYQKDYNVPIYIGEFSAPRWAPDDSAAAWLRDCISLFEEFGWDWSYHSFREWHAWNVELGPDPGSMEPSPSPTSRQLALQDGFKRNEENSHP